MARFAFLTEVRDCEKYLPQAIESILGQTWQDFNYYITDDGSQDGTREIIKAYAAKDPRIIPDFCTGDMHGNFNKTLKQGTLRSTMKKTVPRKNWLALARVF